MSSAKVCYISDMSHHYREPIFKLMADYMGCHFYFGDKSSTIKPINVEELKGFKSWLSYFKIFRNFHYLRGSISTALQYDKIILLGDPHGLQNWLICILARVFGKEVVLWTHGWYGKETAFKGILKIALFRLASRVWVYGPRAKKLLASKGVSPRKVDVVFNSLDYNKQIEAAKNNSISGLCHDYFSNNLPVITYVGRVQRVKRLDLVVHALYRLKLDGVFVNFVLVGGLDNDEQIQREVSCYGLEDQVWFYGPCYKEEELCRVFGESSVCVSPGNVGLTAIHSLTYGCPVITHDRFDLQMPEFEAIIPGETGDFYEYGDVEDLANRIKKWVEVTGEAREAVREKCRSEVSLRWNPVAQIKVMCKSIGVGFHDID